MWQGDVQAAPLDQVEPTCFSLHMHRMYSGQKSKLHGMQNKEQRNDRTGQTDACLGCGCPEKKKEERWFCSLV